jgi:hypothetical protein
MCLNPHFILKKVCVQNRPENRVKDAENMNFDEKYLFICKNLLEFQQFSFFVLELLMQLGLFLFFVLDKI